VETDRPQIIWPQADFAGQQRGDSYCNGAAYAAAATTCGHLTDEGPRLGGTAVSLHCVGGVVHTVGSARKGNVG
jgi:hypothetical protein